MSAGWHSDHAFRLLAALELRTSRAWRMKAIADALRDAHARGVEEGRALGRADVAKYSAAIGAIEEALGLPAGTRLRETVRAVESLAAANDARETQP